METICILNERCMKVTHTKFPAEMANGTKSYVLPSSLCCCAIFMKFGHISWAREKFSCSVRSLKILKCDCLLYLCQDVTWRCRFIPNFGKGCFSTSFRQNSSPLLGKFLIPLAGLFSTQKVATVVDFRRKSLNLAIFNQNAKIWRFLNTDCHKVTFPRSEQPTS